MELLSRSSFFVPLCSELGGGGGGAIDDLAAVEANFAPTGKMAAKAQTPPAKKNFINLFDVDICVASGLEERCQRSRALVLLSNVSDDAVS